MVTKQEIIFNMLKCIMSTMYLIVKVDEESNKKMIKDWDDLWKVAK